MRRKLVVPKNPAIRAESEADAMQAAKKIIGEIQSAFTAFRAENDAAITELKKTGRDDVVAREKIDRINADMTAMQRANDDLGSQIAALRTSGTVNAGPSAAVQAHRTAFGAWARRGTDPVNGMRDLEIKAEMTVDSNPDGGYVVPVTLDTQIGRVLSRIGGLRSAASVISITGHSYTKPHNLGGATAGWVGERDTRPETATPTGAMIAIDTHELYAQPAVSQTLLDDASQDIEAFLADEIGLAFGEVEGVALISGDGVKKPRGLLSYTNVPNASYAWGKIGYVASGVAGDLLASSAGTDKLLDLVYGLKRGYRAGASWLVNDLTVAKVRKLKDADNNYIWTPSLLAGEASSLLGYSVNTDDFMPDFAANAFPLAFGDFKRAYKVVDRMGTRLLRDPYTRKPFVLFYTTKRVGGGVQDFEAVKLLKASVS